MSMVCEICGKGKMVGRKVSHSHIKTKTIKKPNLQRVKVVDNGVHKTMRVCTRCIRSGLVRKVP